jgi:hypothetical protein
VAGNVSEIPGLRVFYRLGGDNLLRFSALVFWFGILVWVPTLLRPDLIRPADIGSDTSNYVAAAERLVEGHSIYALEPGDRPVPQDNQPEWSGPILSPPTVATTWAALTWLPAPIQFHLTWALGLAAATALGLYLVMRLGPAALLLSLIALYPLGVVAWSGNLNAMLAPALAAVWLAFRRDRTGAMNGLIGVLVGLAAALKLGPVILVWWLITQRRWWAVAATIGTISALVGATWLLGGTKAFTDYLQLLGSAGAAPSPLSLPGLAAGAGFDPLVGYGAIVVLGGASTLALLVLRSRPGLTFALAVLCSLVIVTIVRVETLVVGIAALTPWAVHRATGSKALPRPSLRTGIAAMSGVVAVAGIVASVATGGLGSSSMALRNDSSEPVVVRFTVPGQYATFGYRLLPGESGIAWANEPGSERGRLVVYTTDCRYIYDVEAGRPAVGWSIGDAAAAELTEPSGGVFLAYDATCAQELRERRGGTN